MQAPKLKIVPLTSGTFDQWRMAAQAHNYPQPPLPKEAIIIQQADGTFVSAVAIYETNGQYILIEDAVSNPEAPLSVKADAAKFTVETLISIANIRGKLLLGNVKYKSLARIMKKMGFVQEPGFCMVLTKPGQFVAPSQYTFENKKEEPGTEMGPSQSVTTYRSATIGESKHDTVIADEQSTSRPEAENTSGSRDLQGERPRPRAKKKAKRSQQRRSPDGDSAGKKRTRRSKVQASD